MAARNSRKPRRTPEKVAAEVVKSYAPETFPEVSATLVAARIEGLFHHRDVAEMFVGSRAQFRESILSIEVMLVALLHFVVNQMDSFNELVAAFKYGKVADLGPLQFTRQAFSQRLGAIPHQLFLHVLKSTGGMLKHKQKATRAGVVDLAPFANGIFAIDDTTLDALVRRTELLKKYPPGDMATLGGRLACAVDLVTAKFEQIVFDSDAAANEKSHVRPLIEMLPKKAMLVFDLGYFSFPLLDWITLNGRHFVTRLKAKCTYQVIEVLADKPHYRDRIVWLGTYRADRAAMPVRLVELHLKGQWWSYVTNVMQPSIFNAQQVWALYSQRWTIEMCFAAVKRALGMAFLRSSKHNGMLSQIWATLTVYQVLQDLRLEIAAHAEWEPDDVSWQTLMRRIGWYMQDLPNETLRDWLCKNAHNMWLKKQGVRVRRLKNLPADVLAEVLPPPPDVDLKHLRKRKARQGDPFPLKKASELLKATIN